MLPHLFALALPLVTSLAAGAPTSGNLRSRADSATVALEGVAKTRCPGGIVPSVLTYGPAYADGPGLLCGTDCFFNGEGTYVSGSESCKALLPEPADAASQLCYTTCTGPGVESVGIMINGAAKTICGLTGTDQGCPFDAVTGQSSTEGVAQDDIAPNCDGVTVAKGTCA